MSDHIVQHYLSHESSGIIEPPDDVPLPDGYTVFRDWIAVTMAALPYPQAILWRRVLCLKDPPDSGE